MDGGMRFQPIPGLNTKQASVTDSRDSRLAATAAAPRGGEDECEASRNRAGSLEEEKIGSEHKESD